MSRSLTKAIQRGRHEQRNTRRDEGDDASQPAQLWLEVVPHPLFDRAAGYAVRR